MDLESKRSFRFADFRYRDKAAVGITAKRGQSCDLLNIFQRSIFRLQLGFS